MKKSIVFFVVLLICIEGVARPVSQQKAENVAMKFLGIEPMTKGADPLSLIWTGEPMTKVGDGTPALYVFGIAGGGFIIIAGDDCLRPVLGYSDDSEFIVKNMPDHIVGWFSSITETVKQARRKGVSQSDEVSNEWKSGPRKSSKKVEMKTALWWQDYPYNMFTPMLVSDGKEHCATGCGTTATAIVMRYHKYPKSGEGTLPDYTYTGHNPDYGDYTRTQTGHSLGHKYDWDNMPLNHLDKSTPSYQAEQVARLMYDCAIMNQVVFTPNYSATDMKNIPFALANYMGYDKSIRHIKRGYYLKNYMYDMDSWCVLYSPNEWESIIRGELDAGRPIIYGGNTDKTRAHAWVIDGYDDNGYFKMNFGWGGNDNGYYLVSYPIDEVLDYTISHEMVIGIMPNMGGEWEDFPIRIIGRSTSNWCFEPNKSFVSIFNLKNDSCFKRYLKVRVALVNRADELKMFLSDPIEMWLDPYQIGEVRNSCIFKTMPDVEDKIVLLFENEGVWKQIANTDEAVIKMKGPSAIDDCTTVSYSKETHILKITTEKDNAIQVYYTESKGKSYLVANGQNDGLSSFNTTTIPTALYSNVSPYDLTVHVFNISESKEFKLKLK